MRGNIHGHYIATILGLRRYRLHTSVVEHYFLKLVGDPLLVLGTCYLAQFLEKIQRGRKRRLHLDETRVVGTQRTVHLIGPDHLLQRKQRERRLVVGDVALVFGFVHGQLRDCFSAARIEITIVSVDQNTPYIFWFRVYLVGHEGRVLREAFVEHLAALHVGAVDIAPPLVSEFVQRGVVHVRCPIAQV